MQVVNSVCDLSEEKLSFSFGELAFLLKVFKQLASLTVFHYKNHLHIGQGKAVFYLNDILVVHRLQHLSLSKDHVYVLCIS